ncbi:hypothetical protein PG996_013461, partial [Apiospora saccharicola]
RERRPSDDLKVSLRHDAPRLNANESEHPGTAWGKGFITINLEDIEEWDDFTEGTVNKALFEILDHPIPQGSHLNAPFGAIDRPTTIKMEEDIDNYFLQVIGPIISHSVECTRELLRDASGNDMALKLRVPFKTEAVKVKLPEEEEGEGESSQGAKRPNFPIYLPAKSMPGMKPPKDVVFVIGESARAMVWEPNCYKNLSTFKKHGKVHLGKVAMYCKAVGTCLAFTMTSVGATIFRFFTIDNGNDQEQQRALRAKDKTCDWVKDWYYRDKYAGQPVQALVKDYIDFDHVGYRESDPDANWRRITRAIDSPRTARTLLSNMNTLHQIGILHRDINSSNVTQGRFLDFSTAWTKPHPCLNTDQIESARDPFDQLGITDAYDVDYMIELWNRNHPPKFHLWFRAAQNHKYVERLRSYSKRVKNRDLKLWEWIRSYRGRPDLYKWEPEDLGAKHRKRNSRRHNRSRKKQAKQIGAQACPKA